MDNSVDCLPWSRCGKFRTCEPCSRIRQAKIADTAEKLLSKYSHVYLSRFTPYTNTKTEIERLKAAIKRQLEQNDAVWSIEVGQDKKLLHLNVLSGISKFKELKQAEYWQGQRAKNIRQLAAYMIKIGQIPTIEQYQGRQYGTWHSMADAMKSEKQLPIIQAAHAEKITLSSFSLNPIYEARQAEIARLRQGARTHEEIANDHLQKLRAFVALNKGTDKKDK